MRGHSFWQHLVEARHRAGAVPHQLLQEQRRNPAHIPGIERQIGRFERRMGQQPVLQDLFAAQ